MARRRASMRPAIRPASLKPWRCNSAPGAGTWSRHCRSAHVAADATPSRDGLPRAGTVSSMLPRRCRRRELACRPAGNQWIRGDFRIPGSASTDGKPIASPSTSLHVDSHALCTALSSPPARHDCAGGGTDSLQHSYAHSKASACTVSTCSSLVARVSARIIFRPARGPCGHARRRQHAPPRATQGAQH